MKWTVPNRSKTIQNICWITCWQHFMPDCRQIAREPAFKKGLLRLMNCPASSMLLGVSVGRHFLCGFLPWKSGWRSEPKKLAFGLSSGTECFLAASSEKKTYHVLSALCSRTPCFFWSFQDFFLVPILVARKSATMTSSAQQILWVSYLAGFVPYVSRAPRVMKIGPTWPNNFSNIR